MANGDPRLRSQAILFSGRVLYAHAMMPPRKKSHLDSGAAGLGSSDGNCQISLDKSIIFESDPVLREFAIVAHCSQSVIELWLSNRQSRIF